MKSIQRLCNIALIGLSTAVIATSCNKVDQFGTTNINPNGATQPITGALLTTVEAQVGHIKPGKAKLEPILVRGNDELGLLAETINAGFMQLEVSRTQQEIQAQSLSSTLEELSGRHHDLRRSHDRLQQLQHVSASLGSSLDIRDALVQLETVALDIFMADPDSEPADAALEQALADMPATMPAWSLLQAEARLRAAPPALRLRTARRRAAGAGEQPAEDRVPWLRRHLHRIGERYDQGTTAGPIWRGTSGPRGL